MDCFEDFLELVHPEDRQPFRQAVYDSLSSGQPLESEFRAVRKDGSLRHLYARAMPVRDAAGEFARHAGICQDITERKQAEEALRESEDRYRSLVISCKEAVLLTALDGRIFAANEAACRMFGRSEQELIQGGRDSFVDSSDPRLPLIQAERARTGRVSGEVTFVRKDGTKFPCELSSAVFTNRHGELRASLFVRDITGRKRTQEALRASEERFRNLAEMLPEIVFETDEKGSLVYGTGGPHARGTAERRFAAGIGRREGSRAGAGEHRAAAPRRTASLQRVHIHPSGRRHLPRYDAHLADLEGRPYRRPPRHGH